MTTLIITAFIYGRTAKRGEIELRPAVPKDIQGKADQLKIWSQSLVRSMSKDLKHSDEWACEICGKPARETKYDVASWTHLPEPRVVVYMHQVCDSTGNNVCSAMLGEQSERMAALSALSPNFSNFETSPGMQFPLSGSCLNCGADKTAISQLSRCGGCKLVRYCGADCQNSDWKRHKKICKMIKSVNWVDGI